MAKVQEGIAIGIGVQADQATVNPNVRDATDLVTTAIPTSPTANEATGILLRSPEDLSKAFERIESEGGRAPGSLSRLSGAVSRVDPVISFTIDAMGSRADTTTPVAGEYDFPEYFLRLIAGARLEPFTPTSSTSQYRFAATDAGAYHTLKIWRGAGALTESWVLIGCTFNLTWNFTAGEKVTIDVDVIADAVTYDGDTETFPPAILSVAYGNQTGGAPIFESAANSLDGVTRGWQTGTLAIAYDENEVQDCNASGGIINSQGTRNVTFEAGFFRDTGDRDFDFLLDDLDSGATRPALSFRLGVVAGATSTVNSQTFLIPNWRITNTDKIDGDSVLRTITGYAVVVAGSGFGSAVDQEFELASV